MTPAPVATDDELRLVHSQRYIDAVKTMGDHPNDEDLLHGLGTEDNPCFSGMHAASAHIAGATLEAARRVWSG
ncbi:MAG: acetoin utilization protein AcuC, partial [Pseudoxanthomonas sp.]